MKICLHVDINKTILLQDGSSGRSFLPSLHSLLSECVWGQYPHPAAALLTDNNQQAQRTVEDWHVITTSPSTTIPEAKFPTTSYSAPVTFGSYVEDHMAADKAQQRQWKTTFATENHPVGKDFYPHFEALRMALMLSDEQKALLQSTEEFRGMTYLQEGYFHILPSFFQLLDYISTLSKEEYDVRLVFRSFGTDIFHVADEITRYCNGKHPFFKPSKLLNNAVEGFDFRLQFPRCSGSFLRTGSESKDVHLSYVSKEGLVCVKSDAKQIFKYMFDDWLTLTKTEHNSDRDRKDSAIYAIAIRDDYNHWHRNRESDNSGKILLVDQNTKQHDDRVIQLFLDDNIERDRAHIVDVRNVESFASIPFETSNNLFIKRMEPWDAVMDRNYFVNIFKELIRTHSNK